MSIPERIAVVSGANRGLGLETVRQLAQAGVHVLLTSRDEEQGRRAAAELVQQGLPVSAHPLDVTDEGSVSRLAEHLRRAHGSLDILVNNAGIRIRRPLDAEVARRTLAVNFLGALRLTDALLPLLRPGGRIVMVGSSLAARTGMLPPPPTEPQEFTQWAQSLIELSEQRGRVEGLLEGKSEGLREGEVRGEARRGAEDVLLVLKARGVALPPAAEQRIASCTDPATLSTWLQRAATATTADEVFEK